MLTCGCCAESRSICCSALQRRTRLEAYALHVIRRHEACVLALPGSFAGCDVKPEILEESGVVQYVRTGNPGLRGESVVEAHKPLSCNLSCTVVNCLSVCRPKTPSHHTPTARVEGFRFWVLGFRVRHTLQCHSTQLWRVEYFRRHHLTIPRQQGFRV